MYARVVTLTAQREKLDEAKSIYQSIEPFWKQQQGFRGAYLLVDRSTGKSISISLWATQTDLEATEASGWYQEQVAKFKDILVTPPVREAYEVGIHVQA